MSTNKSLGGSKLKSNPQQFQLILKNKCITNDKLGDYAITPDKLNNTTIALIQEMIDQRIQDLQNQIDGYNAHGVFVSNEFGNDPHISVSQQTLTAAFTRVWNKLHDLAGDSDDIDLEVVPDFFITSEGSDLVIDVTPTDEGAILEKVVLYTNNTSTPVAVFENVESVHYTDLHITDTTKIICVAQIMGIQYTAEKTVYYYSDETFWLGAGATYEDVMIPANMHKVTSSDMSGSYQVTTTATNNKIFVIIGEGLTGIYQDITMGDIEIPTTQASPSPIEGFEVFVSDNTYAPNTYTIEVNG